MKKRIVTIRQSLCWHEASAILGGIELLASEVTEDKEFREHYDALINIIDKRLGYLNGDILDMFVLMRQEEITEDDEDEVKGPEVEEKTECD